MFYRYFIVYVIYSLLYSEAFVFFQFIVGVSVKNFLILAIIFIFSMLFQANAFAVVIRDSEIEEVIEEVIAPLKQVAGMEDLKIIVIDDKEPNAFTAGGNIIILNTGLIIKFSDPDVLRGVIAHEIGHIISGHVARRQEIIDNYQKASIAASALGIGAAIAGAAAEGIAITMGGLEIANKRILSYSRSYESGADNYAMQLLEKSGHSSIGMIKFFETMRLQPSGSLSSPYERTHPLGKDRTLILKSFLKRSKFPNSQNSQELSYKFNRISTKLKAYTLDLDKMPECNFVEDADELTHYMKAIKCYRIGSFDDALNHVNRLLMKKPKDPYYHELKGEIYFKAGKKLALHEYDMAIEIKPHDALLRLGRAIIGITTYRDDHYSMNNYYKDLSFVLAQEPKNLLALYYASIYYDAKGMKGKSYLNTAKISLYSGNIPNAQRMARAAMKELKNKSPEWYEASDVLATIEDY